jgi:hypothetical protein
MSLKIGGSKSKTTNTSNSTSSSTTTPIVPEWATSLTQGIAGRVGEVNGLDPYSLVAPVNDLQSRAAAGAAGLTGSSWNFDGAADLMRGAAGREANTYAPTFGAAEGYQAAQGAASSYDGARLGPATNAQSQSLLDNLDAYMSPYRRDVVNSALADYDFGAGQTRAQQDLDLAGAGAFGGSGAALTRSMTEDALTRGRATTSSNLLDQMFNRGAALSGQDADRRQQAALANAAAANQVSLSQAGFDQEAGLANLAGRNQYGLANLDALNQAGQFNTQARNQFGLANAGAANQAEQFNAGAREQTLQRQMDAARGLADISSAFDANQRGNIATQLSAGGTLRDIDQQQRQAPVTHAQQVVAMLSGLPINLFTGQQEDGTQSGTSTSKTKESNWGVGAAITDAFPGMSWIKPLGGM